MTLRNTQPFEYKIPNPQDLKKQRERVAREKTTAISASIPKDLMEAVDLVARQANVSKSHVITCALEDFFNNYK